MSFQTTDLKKDDYRKYLEKAGVLDQLTRVLVGLYEEPEKPANAIDFVKKYLGSPTDIEAETLRVEYETAKEKHEELERHVEDLKAELEKLQPTEEADS